MTHAHGDRNRYLHGPDIHDQPGKGCRCRLCRKANTRAANKRRQAIHTGEHQPMVDADPVRQHIRALKTAGLSYQRVAQLAGVSRETVNLLLYGKPTSGVGPTRRLDPAKAAAILAVTADQLPEGGWVPDAGTRRRLQALAVVGWSSSQIAARAGLWKHSIQQIINSGPDRRVDAGTARMIRAIYDQLWNVDPTAHGCSPTAVKTVQVRAARNGWAPPAAWDDDLIDLPDADLATELERLMAGMDEAELASCWTARYKQGDLSPLTAAAAREHGRRKNATVRAAVAAAGVS